MSIEVFNFYFTYERQIEFQTINREREWEIYRNYMFFKEIEAATTSINLFPH